MAEKSEVESVVSRVQHGSKENIPFHSDLLPYFVEKAMEIKHDGEEICEWFEEYPFHKADDFDTSFPRIYFWKFVSRYYYDTSSKILKCIGDFVRKIYFEEEKIEKLAEEICHYCDTYAQDFEDSYYKSKKHFSDFLPFLSDTFYPVELFGKVIVAFWNNQVFQGNLKWRIKESVKIKGSKDIQDPDKFETRHEMYLKEDLLNAIPDAIIKAEVEKIINEEERRINDKKANEDSKQKNKKENEDIKRTEAVHVPLSKEMSYEEIMNRIKEHGSYLLERATEEQNECVYKFMLDKTGIKLWANKTKEEFIDFLLNTEMLKRSKGRHLPPDHKDKFWDLFKEEHKKMRENYLKGKTDNEIIMAAFYEMYNRLFDGKFYDEAQKALSGEDSVVEPIMKMPIYYKEIKIMLLLAVNTNKARDNAWKAYSNAWELLNKENLEEELKTREKWYKFCGIDPEDARRSIEHENQNFYILIINKWEKYFPMKLIRKEVEEENTMCIKAVAYSKNEYVKNFLIAYSWRNQLFKNKRLACLDYCHDDSYLDILLYALHRNEALVEQNYSNVKQSLYFFLSKEDSIDLYDLIKQDSIFSERLKPFIGDLVLNWRETIMSGDFDKINYIISKTPESARANGDTNSSYSYYLIRRWLDGGDAPKIEDFSGCDEKLLSSFFGSVILERPLKIPGFSNRNESLMERIFSKGYLYNSFVEENYQLSYNGHTWIEYFKKFIEKTAAEFEQPEFPEACLPLEPEYAQSILSRTDSIFNTGIENRVYSECKTFLKELRKQQIKKLLKKETLQKAKAEELFERAENPDENYYAWSDWEEPDFMAHIFEKAVLWVLNHYDSELWFGAPWFGMRIFEKSYTDKPSVWAKHLVKILREWNGSKEMLWRISVALGQLREPLGGEVPIALQQVAEAQEGEYRKDILIQRNLFNRENFNRGHHKKSSIRVSDCQKTLIRGQNEQIEK
jgi:hypothetical protein